MIIEYLNRVRNLKTQKSQGLSTREYQTLLLLTHGYSLREMAEVLDCSVKTIEKFMGTLSRKIRSTEPPGPSKITTAATYVKWAMNNGFIKVDDWLVVSYVSPFNLPKGWKQ